MTIQIQPWSPHVALTRVARTEITQTEGTLTRVARVHWLYRLPAIVGAAVAVVGACVASPSLCLAQSSSNAGQGGGFSGLGSPHGGSGFGLSAGPMGSPSSLGGLSAGSGAGKSGAGAQGGPRPAISGVPASGRPASKSNEPSIGSQLSAGPYGGARPSSGLSGHGGKSSGAADKIKQTPSTASAGKSKQWNYTYGQESLGTNTSSVYKSPYKTTTDTYQWGAISH